jgi:creatinine amidohydrolase
LPVGVLERHAPHMPLGTDVFEAEAVAVAAAAKEYAVVHPAMVHSVNTSSANRPGAIDLRPTLLLAYFQAVCDEIARNGFTKILLLNFHGGNRSFMPLLVAEHKRRCADDGLAYDLYLPDPPAYAGPEVKQIFGDKYDDHAGDLETSLLLHLRPDLVQTHLIPDHATTPRPDYPPKGIASSYNFVASFPDHYAGDARPASAERGARFLDAASTRIAAVIRAIKSDTQTAAERERYRAGVHPARPT